MNNKKIVSVILVVFWIAIIFLFSSMSGDISSKTSDGLIKETIKVIYKIINKPITNEQLESIIDYLSYVIRKMAHFIEFLILGFLVLNLLFSFNINPKYLLLYASIICVLYATSDEIHQFFIPGRSCQFFDVFIDSIGSFSGIFIAKKVFK